jgi:hypothetical protein
MFKADASVSPLGPPRIEKAAFTATQSTPWCSRMACTIIQAPKSEGMESKPRHGMMRVPST